MKQKPYIVGTVAGQPNFDSLPVAKITHYPLEPRDYKPFAQSILCIGPDTLHLRMWAFEVSPMPTSALACVLYPWPEQADLALCLRIEHGEGDAVGASVSLARGGVEEPRDSERSAKLQRHPHNGEDLQGAYWGESLALPLSVIGALGGPCDLRAGATISGNFYKLCADERFAHMGSLFPARFPDDAFLRDSMGPFEIVSY